MSVIIASVLGAIAGIVLGAILFNWAVKKWGGPMFSILFLCLTLCGLCGCVELNKSFYMPDSWNATAYMNPDGSLNTYAVGLNYPFPFRVKQTP